MTPLIAALVMQGQVPSLPADGNRFTQKVAVTTTTGYLISFPDGYESNKTKKWPLVLFLHGAGERGEDLEKNRAHGPFKELAKGRKIPAIVIAPQCPMGEWWSSPIMVETLKGLLNDAEKRYRVDRSRELLTGLSMGGYGTWQLATDQPTRFAALAPICGNGDPARVAVLKSIPIWTTHGDKDASVPVQGTRDLVAALRAVGSNVRYDEIAGGGHDVWSDVYANDAFWDWLLSQKKG